MIVYVASVMVHSRSERGNGQLAWRLWQASRHFRNHEVPCGFVGEGSSLTIGLPMTCVSQTFHIGGRAFDVTGKLVQDNTVPVMILGFHLAAFTTSQIDGVPCYGKGFDTSHLAGYFTKAGFEIMVHKPHKVQEPTSPPPGEAG